MMSRRSGPLAVWVAVTAAVLGVLGAPASANAAESPSEAVSWSVSPADATGDDGRVSIQHVLDPGESVDEHVVVRNLGASDVVFSLSAADGFYTDAGRFDMLPSDQESTGSGSWISIPDEVAVPAGSSAVVAFTITVPENAEPGDHAAGVAASVMSVQKDESGATAVGVESRVGVKVITRVAGAISPAFDVLNVHRDYQLNANPFAAGELAVTFDVQNTGNARVTTAGALDIAGQAIPFPIAGERSQVLFPGERRSFTLTAPDIWPLFFLGGELSVEPTAASMDGGVIAVEAEVVSLNVWVMPWPQLLAGTGLVLLLVALLWSRIRSRRRVDDLISKAVERGRAEALSESSRRG
ncbi:COG1470 family protein [Microbacterium sp. GXF0217]